MIEEYLKKILSAEEKAKKIEDDAQHKAETIIASANQKRDELLAHAERRAAARLSKLRAQAEADGKAEVAKREEEHKQLINALRGRYQKRHTEVVDKANLDLSTLLSLAKE